MTYVSFAAMIAVPTIVLSTKYSIIEIVPLSGDGAEAQSVT